MASTFAAITEAQIAELSPADIALVSGGGWEWGVQDPDADGPIVTDSWDWT